MYKCGECISYYKNPSGLYAHVRKKHKGEYPSGSTKRLNKGRPAI